MSQWFRSTASSRVYVPRLLIAGLIAFGIGLIGQRTGHEVEATSAPESFPSGDLFPDMTTTEGSFTVSPSQGTYTIGTDITLEATGAVDPDGEWDYAFDYWEGLNTTDYPNGPGGPGTSDANPLTFTLTNGQPKTSFFFLRYRLRTFTSGQGAVSPSGGFYPVFTLLNLVPTPDPGWEFSHWELALSGSQVPGVVWMTIPRWVRAVFTPLPTYSLTTTVEGGGTVDLEASPVSPGVYWEGADVQVTATPSPGWAFHHWEGDLVGSLNPNTVTMTGNKSVHAVFYPSVEFSAASSTVDESAGIANLPVSLGSAPGIEATVNYTVTGGTAIGSGVDYALASGQLVFAPNDTDANIAISIQEDSLEELGGETVEITLSSPTNAVLGTQVVHTLTIQDDTTVRFAESTSTVSETATTGSVEVILSSSPSSPVTVDYAVTGASSATGNGVDYTLAAGTLNFAQGGDPSADISFQIHDDNIFEFDEGVIITLSNPSNAVVSTPSTHLLLIEDDDPSPIVQFTSASSAPDESDGVVTVDVTLSNPSAETVFVDFSLDGTANVADYTSSPQPPISLSIGPGVLSKPINIDINDDDFDELDETVLLRIDGARIVTVVGPFTFDLEVGAIDEHTLTIFDNEAEPTIEFSANSSSRIEDTVTVSLAVALTHASSEDVTIDYSVGGSATPGAGDDYTIDTSPLVISAGSTSGNIDVVVNEDTIDEADETVVVTLDGASALPLTASIGGMNEHTLTITDDDDGPVVDFALATTTADENVGTVSLLLSLSNASSEDISLTYSVPGSGAIDEAIDGTDFVVAPLTLTVPAGETVWDIDVDITNDQIDELDETVAITLTDASTPNLTASIGNSNVNTLTINDDDTTSVTFGAPTVGFGEGAGNVVVPVSLTLESSREVTVDYAAADFTATGAGVDYTANGTNPLTFPAGSTADADIPIEIINDDFDEHDETFNLTLSNPTNAALGISVQTVTIQDDDADPVVNFVPIALSKSEGDGAIGLNVSLSPLSSEDITLTYSVTGISATDGEDFSYVGNSATISKTTPSVSIPLTILDDSIHESDETVVVSIMSATASTLGVSLGDDTHTLTIADNDGPPEVNFDLELSSAEEDDGTVSLAAKLTHPSSEVITVTLVSPRGGTATEGPGEDYTIGTLVFPIEDTEENLDIVINNDLIDESDETVVVTLDSASGPTLIADIGAMKEHTLTIIDDDTMFLAHWPFDGPTLAEMDDDIGTHTLELSLGTQASLALSGIDDEAMLVTPGTPTLAVADRGESGETVLDLSAQMTVMTWFKLSNAGTDYTILSKRDPADANTGYEVVVNPVGNNNAGIMLEYGDTTSAVSVYSDEIVFEVGEWYHLGVVFDSVVGDDVAFYINGLAAGTNSGHATGFAANDSNFKVGADENDASHFDGFLDELILQNAALSAQDVFDEYAMVEHTFTDESEPTEGHIDLDPSTGGVYTHGVVVDLDAEAESDWTFVEWGGTDVGDLLIDENDAALASIRMNGDKGISASFEKNPIADFDFAINDLTVTFTNLSDTEWGGGLLYDWDFGDDNTSQELSPTHTYAAGGVYTVALTVKNNGGVATATEADDVILVESPTAAIQIEFIDTVEPYEILLTDVSIPADGGTIDTWSWSATGFTITSPNDSGPHSISGLDIANGPFDVTLTVTQDDGGTDSVTVPIDIGQSPKADFAAAPPLKLVDHDVLFTDTSTEGGSEITQWDWEFEAGVTASGPGPHRHAYTSPGQYTAKLTVRNSFGTDTKELPVTIEVERSNTEYPDFKATITELKVNGGTESSGAQVKAADSISVESDVLNDSMFTPLSGGRSDALYLSLDETLDENDLQIQSDTTSSPLTGGVSESVVLGTIGLQDVAPGTYFLIVSLDDDGMIDEVAENNNTATIGIVVVDTELTHE